MSPILGHVREAGNLLGIGHVRPEGEAGSGSVGRVENRHVQHAVVGVLDARLDRAGPGEIGKRRSHYRNMSCARIAQLGIRPFSMTQALFTNGATSTGAIAITRHGGTVVRVLWTRLPRHRRLTERETSAANIEA